MHKPSQYINDICSECNPRTYDMTLAKYAKQENLVEASDPDDSFIEYLYECCQCGFKSWVDEQWVRNNAVVMDPIQHRKEYIAHKSIQLDKLTDADKYTRRLARIMLYHKLLSKLEADAVKKLVQTDEREEV